MSASDPKSPEQLRAIARRAAAGPISSNDRYELDRQISQAGPLGRELKQILEGKA